MSRSDDASYKLLFSSPELVRDLVLGFIPDEWLHSLDYSTLEKLPGSYVSDDLRHRADDVIWRVRTGEDWVYLYLLIEFQSSPDRWMAVRMMTYLGLLYQDLIRRKELSAGRRLPPVLPIVLYNGDARWTAATDIADLIPKAPGLVAQYLPRLKYLLLDESELARRADLSQLKNLMAAVVRLEHPENETAIIALIDELNEWLQGEPELRRLFAIWIRALLLRRNKEAWALPKVQDLKELRMGLAEKVERWAKEHEQRGEQRGRQEGLREGLEKGQAEGAQQAQTLILQRLLARRFGELPPQILGKIQHASPGQVDTWIDRVLDAPTLEAIFDT
ncbi:MAG: Rpn family recombination-promoting nuclease/putative transposase [Lautropia sp.]|nr:Rpn family recombination-promoting nuclease/putative transposase [Lautropia sp.]